MAPQIGWRSVGCAVLIPTVVVVVVVSSDCFDCVVEFVDCIDGG